MKKAGRRTISNSIELLIARARAFRAGPYTQQQPLYNRLVREGQSPKIMMIACSDSRVDPSLIFDSEPGDIFMVRNVASLVPPCVPDESYHGTSAALEYAVLALRVEHIVVLGHGYCGGIDALLRGIDRGDPRSDFIGPWLRCAADVRDLVVERMPDSDHGKQARELEYESARQSVRNLMTFPWIQERVEAGALKLHAWHFDIAEGTLTALTDDGNELLIGGEDA